MPDQNLEKDKHGLNLKAVKPKFRGYVIAVVATLIVSASVFVFTPLLSLLNLSTMGGYVSKELIVDNLNKLDSLRYQVELWRFYNQNILDIIAGNKPSITPDSVDKYISNTLSKKDLSRSSFEDVLRKKVAENSKFAQRDLSFAYGFYPPLSGVVTTPFRENSNKYIIITVYEPKEVLTIADGTVVASYWSSQYGNVVQVQHSDNMISVYSSLSISSVTVGEKILAGGVIGYVGRDDEQNKTNFGSRTFQLKFELWHNGNRVNPENYIVF